MNLYLISGDDIFEKEKYIENIKSKFANLKKGVNLIAIDKDNINTLEQELSTYSFFGDEKLIIVKIPKKNKEESVSNDWLTESLIDLLGKDIEGTTLVFVEDGTSKGKLYNTVSKYGKYVLFEKNKKENLVPWIMELCKQKNIVIAPNIISYFVDVCGTDKQTLYNEVNKLMDYVGEKGIIDKSIIDLLCVRTSEVIIFDLTDALGKKNIKRALKCMDDLLESKEPLQKIMIMITKHIKMLLLAKVSAKEGKSLVKDLGVNAYAAKKYADQAGNFKEDELFKLFDDLAQLDVDSKIGKIDLRIGIEKIFIGL